jgi:hypothetical protein
LIDAGGEHEEGVQEHPALINVPSGHHLHHHLHTWPQILVRSVARSQTC